MADVDPTDAQNGAEYTLLLRLRREAAGLTYRQLARRARQAEESLPPSTVATMLRRSTLPSRDLVATYIRACGGGDEEIAAWLVARARIAMATAAVPPAARNAAGAARSTSGVFGVPVPPRQLPPAVAGFVGRQGPLADLDATIDANGSGLVVVSGPPGVGKTGLAAYWAHRVKDRFPDGQLYVDLGGSGDPRSTRAALVDLLVAFGVSAGGVPTDARQAAGLFRSVVAERQLLLLLDDAASTDQIRLLRPAGPGALTVVTSRHRLLGLAVRDGAQLVDLTPLDRRTAVRMLARCVGEPAVAAEPETAGVLADLCEGLPLALRIAAVSINRIARAPLADIVARMHANGRLAALGTSADPQARLESAFDRSYRPLDDTTKRLFRLLGTTPPASATASDLAAALAVPPADAWESLNRLVDAHLVVRRSDGHYGMSGLLREYAGQLPFGQPGRPGLVPYRPTDPRPTAGMPAYDLGHSRHPHAPTPRRDGGRVRTRPAGGPAANGLEQARTG